LWIVRFTVQKREIQRDEFMRLYESFYESFS